LDYLKKDIVVVGLGYVGLPLAVKLASAFNVIGFDISEKRCEDLRELNDSTKEVNRTQLKKAERLKVTSRLEDIEDKYIYIITVPTPVNKNNLPDLSLLKKACRSVGSIMTKKAIVIFESTVYPGVTEKICSPILSKNSGYSLNKNYFIGYSPERINPGDKKHSVDKIVKVVSGSNKEITKIIGKIYESIITAGVFYAKSIEVAETAKAIENAQRDINIAFINEIALLCQKLNISVYDVLDAAKTKWNFLPFYPGLVGGHCIGVDPYYLSHVAKKLGSNTEVILSGRRLNDKMTSIIYKKISKQISSNKRILQIGVSFKENVPDIRNSKAAELAKHFLDNNYNIEVYDPIVDQDDVYNSYNIKLLQPKGKYDSIIIAVPHDFINQKEKLEIFTKKSTMIFDITGKYKDMLADKNIKYWSL
jgi:UDP-N-acetyl-D-glucosamine/UDP-N-acetyl-D-galactosamine dehydrogenase